MVWETVFFTLQPYTHLIFKERRIDDETAVMLRRLTEADEWNKVKQIAKTIDNALVVTTRNTRGALFKQGAIDPISVHVALSVQARYWHGMHRTIHILYAANLG